MSDQIIASSRLRAPVLASLLLSLSGCGEQQQRPTALAAPVASPSESRFQRALPPAIRPEEAAFASLASEAPSSAGFFVDSGGSLHVRVALATHRDAARGAVARMLHQKRFVGLSVAPRIDIDTAEFSFAELAALRDRLFDDVLTQGLGAHSLDLDERRNRVVVGVLPGKQQGVLDAAGKDADQLGISRLAVVVEVQEPLVVQSAPRALRAAFTAPDLFSPTDTLVGGLSVDVDGVDPKTGKTGPSTCTIGFAAIRNGVTGFVTATHCTRVWGGGPDGTVASRNGVTTGTEAFDPNKYPCGLNYCRASDAAFFQATTPSKVQVGYLARPVERRTGCTALPCGSLNIDTTKPYLFITDIDNGTLLSGTVVDKIGIRTGWTYGTVSNTCIDHTLGNFPEQYTTRCTYGTTVWTDEGDSGGPFFWFSGQDEVTLLGTLVGRTPNLHVFSKYSRIVSDLGTMTVGLSYTLSTPSLSGAVNGAGNPVITWNSVAGATYYAVYRTVIQHFYDEWGNETGTTEERGIAGTTATSSFTDTSIYSGGYAGTGWNSDILYTVRAFSASGVSAQANPPAAFYP